jgi:hypothetical protein
VSPQLLIAAIIAAIGFSGGFGVAWKMQAGTINAKDAQYAESKLAQVQQSAAADIRRLDNTITAQNRSTNRAVALRRDLDSARSELERLRIAIAHGVPGTSAAADACPESGSERDNVLLECIASYETLARDADLWKNDALMLRDAWPTR